VSSFMSDRFRSVFGIYLGVKEKDLSVLQACWELCLLIESFRLHKHQSLLLLEDYHIQQDVFTLLLVLFVLQDNEAENADEEDELETKGEAQTSVQNSAPKKSTPTANATKSKKKKNKGKNKGKTPTALPVEPTPVKDEESVDELLEKLALQNGETASASETSTSQPGVNHVLM
jgi:hypothetical protein